MLAIALTMFSSKQSYYWLSVIALLGSVLFTTGCFCSDDDVIAPSILRIEVAPLSYSMKIGTTQQYTATAIYADGSKADISLEAAWTASEGKATIAVDGLLTAAAAGESSVTAYHGGFTSTAPLSVHDKVTQSLEVDPATVLLLVGEVVEMRAVAIFADGSQQNVVLDVAASLQNDSGIIAAVDSSLAPVVTQITDRGTEVFDHFALLQGVKVGSDVLVTSFDGVNAEVPIEVTGSVTLVELVVSPGDAVTTVDGTVQYAATGLYSDGSSRDLTQSVFWSADSAAVASVSNDSPTKGLARALAAGQANVIAEVSGVQGSAALTVNANAAPILDRLEVNPPHAIVRVAELIRFTAIAHYSDHSTEVVTDLATWSSSNDDLAVIGNSKDWAGVALGRQVGAVTIQAQYRGVLSNAVELTVLQAALVRITVAPVAAQTPVGTRIQFSATAHYADGSTQDVTRDATWKSSNRAVLAIATATERAGLALGTGVGSADIKAVYGGQENSVLAVVTTAVLQLVVVTPPKVSVPNGQRVWLRATGIYSDLSATDLTFLATWKSTDTSIATVSVKGARTGLVSTHAQGQTAITASFEGVAGSAAITVTAAVLRKIQVEPGLAELPNGTQSKFRATAYFSDKTSLDVTKSATWNSSNVAVLHISNKEGFSGVAYALAEGAVTITAFWGAQSGTAQATVTPAVLQSITLGPQGGVVIAGEFIEFEAVGIYSDGSHTTISSLVSWQSSDPSVAIAIGRGAAAGIVQGVVAGTAAITASHGGITGQANLIVSAAVVSKLQITPANLSEPAGTSGILTATATMSDGTSRDVTTTATWTSDDPSVVTVVTGNPEAGKAYLLKKGVTDVVVTLSGITDRVTVTVTDAVLIAIQVSPLNSSVALGTGVSYSAQGVFSDGTITPIDEDVAWESLDLAVATISSSGAAQSIGLGTTTITATLNSIVGQASLAVTAATIVELQISPPLSSEPAGTSGQLTATAVFTNGTTQDVTGNCVWSSSDTNLAYVGNGGFTGATLLLAAGDVTLSARLDAIADSIDVTVTAAVLVGINLAPLAVSIHAGGTVEFTAHGVYSDGSTTPIDTDVHWASSDTSVVTVDQDGTATTLRIGAVTISATHAGGLSSSTSLTVTSAIIQRIELSPQTATLPNGNSVVFSVTGIYSDASTAPITDGLVWNSTNLNVLVIDQAVATGVGLGNSVVEVDLEGTALEDSATVTVTTAVLSSIVVSLVDSVLAKGTETQATAAGEYSDGTIEDLTAQVVWTSADSSLATVSNDTGTEGHVWALEVGETQITATAGAIAGSSPVTVTSPVLQTIDVEPAAFTIALGNSQIYLAWGNYSDGSRQDIGDVVSWASTNPSVAVIGSDGLAVSVAAGSTNIRATLGVVVGTTTLTVDGTLPTGLVLTPVAATVADGTQIAFTATLTVGGEASDITGQVVWSSNNTAIATVSNAAADAGIVQTIVDGSVTISAQYYHAPSDTVFNASEGLTVIDLANKPDALEIRPVSPSLAVDGEIQLHFWGIWNPGTMQEFEQELTSQEDTSWKSKDKKTLDVDNDAAKGLCKAKKTGVVEIEAKFKGDSVSINVTVTN